jgi:hypothetical protein
MGGPVKTGEVGEGILNPAALTVDQAARMLDLPGETIRQHVEQGLPTDAGGRISLVVYVAWLLRRMKD